MRQAALFDDTGLLPLFAECPRTVEVDPFEQPRETTEEGQQMLDTMVETEPSERDNEWQINGEGKWVRMPSDISRAYDLLVQADDLAHKLSWLANHYTSLRDVENSDRCYRIWLKAHTRWGRRAWTWHKLDD